MHKGNMKGNWFLKGLMMFVFMIIAAAFFGAVVMLLWNALMPSIFGLEALNFWQALGLLALSRILFGSFGKGRGCGGRHHSGKAHWKKKWMNMSAEERAAFKSNLHNRCRTQQEQKSTESSAENGGATAE